MTFTSLASSSAGNAYLVSDGSSRLLLECGISYKRLRKLLGFTVSGLAGCLVSHEHKDHARCWLELVKDGVPVYVTEGTADALEAEGVQTFVREDDRGRRRYKVAVVGTFAVLPFATFHDAVEPVGFLVQSLVDGERLLFATDTAALAYQVGGLDLIAIESNYEEALLARAVHLPEKVIVRIRNTHMEVERVCAYLRTLDLSRCREVYLLHMSDACANEGRMVDRVGQVVPGIQVTSCPK